MIYIFTGSGISVESGIPTFRDKKTGLWENFDPDRLCSMNSFHRNAKEIHEFYSRLRKDMFAVDENGSRILAPNHSHDMIAKWQREYGAVVMTQNVDDLHECAGSQDVIHLHGRMEDMRCLSCGHEWSVGATPTEYGDIHCPLCGSDDVKPGVVFFGEQAPKYEKMYDAFQKLTDDDIIIIMGTSGQVIPFDIFLNGLPGLKILNNLAPNTNEHGIELPMNTTGVFDHLIYAKASDGVDAIDDIIRKTIR